MLILLDGLDEGGTNRAEIERHVVEDRPRGLRRGHDALSSGENAIRESWRARVAWRAFTWTSSAEQPDGLV